MNTDIKNLIKYIKHFAGFSLVGLFITILSLLAIIYFVEFIKVSLLIAYPLIYFISVIASYYLNKDFVFKYRGRKNKFVLYFIIYLSSMLLGIILIYTYKQLSSLSESVIAILVLPVTTIYNFILVYLIFKSDNSKT